MKNTIKFSIIIISVIIFIILISIALININEERKIENEKEQEIIIAEQVKVEELEEENKIYNYLNVNEALNNMFNYISKEDKNALLSLLDNQYKLNNNVTESNILDTFIKYKDINSYFTKEIYTKEIAQRQNINGRYLYTKGIIRKDAKEEYIYTLIKQDLINSTYSISILNEEEFNNKGKENSEISIEENSYNKIFSNGITDYKICLAYFNDYINTIKNNPEYGYNLLDEEYRNNRFNNIQNYIEYVNEIQSKLLNATLNQYSVEANGEDIYYICVDQLGNYYIFKKQNMMNYTLMLDTYTIDQPQFLEKYNKANTMEKVGYNIQKCIEAINNKNYSYIYNKLDEEFKNTNYKEIKLLQQDIEDNLFEGNKVKSVSSLNEGNIYIYKLTILDMQDNTKEQNMTVIMQLKEGTDFVMSFSFE